MPPKYMTNVRIKGGHKLQTPAGLKRDTPLTRKARHTVFEARKELKSIMDGEDSRLVIIVGPCSIHDEQSAIEYARRIADARRQYGSKALIIMRTYFEKPRTTIGWTGFLNDPHLDGTFQIDEGRERARRLLLRINEIGVPVATEYLDANTPQFIDDLITWAAIGARTTESPKHRHMASGLSVPVGFKNATSGDIKVAIDGVLTARESHHFLGLDAKSGRESVMHSTGNPYGHLILRGGADAANFDEQSVQSAQQMLQNAGLPPLVMIDCSHGNARGKDGEKDYRAQGEVFREVVRQHKENQLVFGAMIESHLEEGSQSIDNSERNPRKSITDACIGWEETERLFRDSM